MNKTQQPAPGAVPVVQAGWQSLPTESTAAMEWVFNTADVTYRDGVGRKQPMDPHSEFKARYAAMLKAAPQAEKAPSAQAVGLLERVLQVVRAYLPPGGLSSTEAMSQITTIVDPWPLATPQPPAIPWVREPLTVDYESLLEDASYWSRHVVEDTSYQTLEEHLIEVFAKHGIAAAPKGQL